MRRSWNPRSVHVMGEAEVLRVNFVDDGSGLRLVPRELGDWRPFFLDLGAEADPEQAAREALADMVRQPFDLERDLLFRLGVVRLAPARSLAGDRLPPPHIGRVRRRRPAVAAPGRGLHGARAGRGASRSCRTRGMPASFAAEAVDVPRLASSSPMTRSSGGTTWRTRPRPRGSRGSPCPTRMRRARRTDRAEPTAGHRWPTPSAWRAER